LQFPIQKTAYSVLKLKGHDNQGHDFRCLWIGFRFDRNCGIAISGKPVDPHGVIVEEFVLVCFLGAVSEQ